MARFPRNLPPRARVALNRKASAAKKPPTAFNDAQNDLHRWQDGSKLEQEEMLNLWEDWCEDEGKGEEYTLRQGWTPPPREELKAFIRWVIHSSGHDFDVPSARGIRNRISKFWSGVLRRTGYAVDDSIKAELHDLIRHRLRREGIVTTETKGKLAFNKEDQKHCLLVLWTEADPDGQFRSGRMRVMLTAAVQLFCYTGARLGAIIPLDKDKETRNRRIEARIQRVVRPGSNFERTTSAHEDELHGIRWRDIQFTLIHCQTSPPELVFTLSQAWIKNNFGDKNNGLKTGLTFRNKLLVDPIPWILALAFTDNAFQHYETVEQLWAQKVPKSRKCLPLKWKEEKQDLHVFRPSLYSPAALDQKIFNRMFQLLMRQSGYTRPVSVQRIREEVTNVVDRADVTEAQRKHAVGQTKSVFNQSYIHSLSGLDIQSLFLGEEQRKDHLEFLSSLSSVLVRGYPIKLPDEKRDQALAADSEYQSLKRTLHGLESLSDIDLREAKKKEVKKKLVTSRARLKDQALKEYQKRWLEQEQAACAMNNDDDKEEEEKSASHIAVSRFAHFLQLAPDRLAVTMAMKELCDYGHHTRPFIINSLIQMAREHDIALHRPDEGPLNGSCPVESCGIQMTGKFYDQQLHIHNCRRKEVEQELGPVKYCFRCFKFVGENGDWDLHCARHLADLSIDCGAVTWHSHCKNYFCVQDGFCPFCTCGPGSACERYRVFNRPERLRTHVFQHIQSRLDWPTPCPHPLCHCMIFGPGDMYIHLGTHHGISGLQKLTNTHSTMASTTASITAEKRSLSPEPGEDAKRRRCISSPSLTPPDENLAPAHGLHLESVALDDEPAESLSPIRGSTISDSDDSPFSTEERSPVHGVTSNNPEMDHMKEFLASEDSNPEHSGSAWNPSYDIGPFEMLPLAGDVLDDATWSESIFDDFLCYGIEESTLQHSDTAG